MPKKIKLPKNTYKAHEKQSQADAEKLTLEERILRLEIDRGIVGPNPRFTPIALS